MWAGVPMHDRSRMIVGTPFTSGTEHVDFSPIRRALLAPSAKRRGVSLLLGFGKSVVLFVRGLMRFDMIVDC